MRRSILFVGLALAALLVLFGASRVILREAETARALELSGAEDSGRVAVGWAELEGSGGSPELAIEEPTQELVDARSSGSSRHSLSAPARSLDVIVRAHGSGVELAGAEVHAVFAREREDPEVATSVTSEEGLAEFRVPGDTDEVRLFIEAEGFVPAFVRSVDFEAGTHVQEMIPAASIEGFVHLDGAGAARILLWDASNREVLATIGDGEPWEDSPFFRFAGLRPGGYALGLELEGRGLDFVANVEVGPGDTETVHLRAPRPGELELQLYWPGEPEEPVVGASVKLIPDRQGIPRPMEDRTGSRREVTDDQGRLRLGGLSPGEWIVDAKYGASKIFRRIEVEEGGRISRVRLPMERAPSLLVELKGMDGADPEHFYVLAEGVSRTGDLFAKLQPDGRFLFSELPANKRLKLRGGISFPYWDGPEDLRPRGAAFVNLKPRKTPHEIELRIAARCMATVVVRLADGQPWTEGAILGGYGVRRRPEPGTYVFMVPPGPAIIETGGDHGQAKRRQRVVVREGEENRFEVTLRAVSEIRGSFTDPTGAALARLRVRARRLDAEEGEKKNFDTRTDAFGEFALGGLPEGRFRLSAITRYGKTGAEGAALEFETPRDSGQFFAMTLPYSDRDPVAVGTIQGRATTVDGERVSRLRVQNLRGGTVSVDGSRFEIRGLRSGRFNLTLVAEGCLPQVLRDVQLADGATIDLGTVEFAPSTRVIVDVRGPDNKRLAEARVELRTRKADLQPGQKPARHRVGNRRKDGRYQRENSPRGRFQLIVRRDGYETYRRNVTVRDQRQQSFRMKLKKRDSNG